MCEKICRIPDCYDVEYDYVITEKNSPGPKPQYKMILIEFVESNELITKLTNVRKIDLITYIVNMGSILSFWFGFSVINWSMVFLGYFNTRQKRNVNIVDIRIGQRIMVNNFINSPQTA